MTTVIIGGPLASKYGNGGIAWNVLSYVLGLKKLGLKVYYLEEISSSACTFTGEEASSIDSSLNGIYFQRITEQFGLKGSAALIDREEGRVVYGAAKDDILAAAEEASLLINISGHLTLGPWLRRIPRKIYIDEDPGFTQFWYHDGNPGIRLSGHDLYYTVGENIGDIDCPIPQSNIAWRTTRQPVVLDHWPMKITSGPIRFTTVASWRGPYGPVEFDGKRFGLKVHEFRKFMALPSLASPDFEVALDIHPSDSTDLESLRRNGWKVINPQTIAADPVSFRSYLQQSSAEFSVAQGIYVETNSGWFSDRSARYLASGKPVLVQDTGFRRSLPVGEGLLTFRDLNEAVSGAERIARDYEKHCHAARAIAEIYFDSNKVLGRLLEEAGLRD